MKQSVYSCIYLTALQFEMATMMKALMSLALAAPAVFGRSLLQTYAPGPAYNAADCQNLTSTFVATPEYSVVRLLAALEETGLLSALENPEAPLTVFAPNNAAFDLLAAAANTTAEDLLALPELTDILMYHVVPTPFANRLAFDQGSAPFPYGSIIPQGTGITVATLEGANLTILNINNTNYLYSYGDEAGITGTYENACNVVLYPIDSVLLPEQDFLFSGAAELTSYFYATLLTPTAITGPEATVDAVDEGNVNSVAQAALDALNSNVTPQQFSSIFLRVLAEPQGPNVLAQVANAMIGLSNCATVSPVLSTVAANLQARNSQVAAYNEMVVAQYPQLAQCFAQATGATSLPAASG
eukprot:jgi/Astpho2/884/Aster-00727